MRERRRGSHLDTLVDVGVDGGKETREGVVAGDVGAVELVDIVFVVLLADRVNTRQDVDDRHPHAPRSGPLLPPQENSRRGSRNNSSSNEPTKAQRHTVREERDETTALARVSSAAHSLDGR
jgi:hypothetical protein